MRLNLRAVLAVAVLLSTALLCSACEAVFLNPLSDSRDAKPDERLLGKWVSTDEHEAGAYIQFDAGANRELNVSASGIDEGQNPGFTMFTTKTGKHTYMNLNPTDKDRGRGYLIVRYAVEGDRLTVWILDSDKLAAAIKRGELKGNPGEGYGKTTVSDTPAKVAAFLESSSAGELFPYAARFERMK